MSRRATGIFLPPPAIYLLFLTLAWLLHWLWHLALPRNLWTHYFGWGLIDAGVLLMLWAGLLMLWRKTTVNPYGKPARLLEEGCAANSAMRRCGAWQGNAIACAPRLAWRYLARQRGSRRKGNRP